jgi:monovalent cation/hydrogen antiporter
LQAGLASFADEESPVAHAVRQEFTAHLTQVPVDSDPDHPTPRSPHVELHHEAVKAARQAVHAMRANDEIGDDAFHQIEEELDWLEMAGRKTTE